MESIKAVASLRLTPASCRRLAWAKHWPALQRLALRAHCKRFCACASASMPQHPLLWLWRPLLRHPRHNKRSSPHGFSQRKRCSKPPRSNGGQHPLTVLGCLSVSVWGWRRVRSVANKVMGSMQSSTFRSLPLALRLVFCGVVHPFMFLIHPASTPQNTNHAKTFRYKTPR